MGIRAGTAPLWMSPARRAASPGVTAGSHYPPVGSFGCGMARRRDAAPLTGGHPEEPGRGAGQRRPRPPARVLEQNRAAPDGVVRQP